MPKIVTDFTRPEAVPANAAHKLQAQVVMRTTHGIAMTGPFLVCSEAERAPRDISGCPNGQVHMFLVNLESGERHNIRDTDYFVPVECSMHVKGVA